MSKFLSLGLALLLVSGCASYGVSVKRWARDLSTPGRPVTPYVIQVGFRDVQQPELLEFFNQVPTSFSLSDEQVDKVIAAGRELLRNNPDFQRFLAGMGGKPAGISNAEPTLGLSRTRARS